MLGWRPRGEQGAGRAGNGNRAGRVLPEAGSGGMGCAPPLGMRRERLPKAAE